MTTASIEHELTMNKTLRLSDILPTDAAVDRAVELFRTCKPGTFAKMICKELIEPRMEEINRKTGQENDPLYISYVIEALMIENKAPGPRVTGLN